MYLFHLLSSRSFESLFLLEQAYCCPQRSVACPIFIFKLSHPNTPTSLTFTQKKTKWSLMAWTELFSIPGIFFNPFPFTTLAAEKELVDLPQSGILVPFRLHQSPLTPPELRGEAAIMTLNLRLALGRALHLHGFSRAPYSPVG